MTIFVSLCLGEAVCCHWGTAQELSAPSFLRPWVVSAGTTPGWGVRGPLDGDRRLSLVQDLVRPTTPSLPCFSVASELSSPEGASAKGATRHLPTKGESQGALGPLPAAALPSGSVVLSAPGWLCSMRAYDGQSCGLHSVSRALTISTRDPRHRQFSNPSSRLGLLSSSPEPQGCLKDPRMSPDAQGRGVSVKFGQVLGYSAEAKLLFQSGCIG